MDGTVAARGTVSRSGGNYTAQVAEGALRDWCIEVDGLRSAMLAEGHELRWSA
jgi:alpha-D-xyloside xylohydrolase